MILGIGIDHVELARFEQLLGRHRERLERRVFRPEEVRLARQSRTGVQSLAARFAAKEAAMKALGTGWTGGVRFVDFQIGRTELGAPELTMSGTAARIAREMGVQRALVSLSHTTVTAVAVVVLEGASSG